METELQILHAAMDNGIRGVFPGISRIVLSGGGECYPEDAGIALTIDGMKELGAGELLLECGNSKLLIVKHDYGDMAAAVYYANGIAPADLSRLIQLMFAGQWQRSGGKPCVPASDVEMLIKRWKRSIAFIFGERFASMLVEKSLTGRDRARMAPGDMDAARAFISSALADCLCLDKVNK